MSDVETAIRRIKEYLEATEQRDKRIARTNVNKGILGSTNLYNRETQKFVPFLLLKEDLVALIELAEEKRCDLC